MPSTASPSINDPSQSGHTTSSATPLPPPFFFLLLLLLYFLQVGESILQVEGGMVVFEGGWV